MSTAASKMSSTRVYTSATKTACVAGQRQGTRTGTGTLLAVLRNRIRIGNRNFCRSGTGTVINYGSGI
jgi:hypothetical protein